MWPLVLTVARHRGPAPSSPMPTVAVVHPHHVLWCHVRGDGWYRCGVERVNDLRPHLGVIAAGETDQSLLTTAFDVRYAIVDTPLLEAAGAGLIRLGLGTQAVRRPHLRPLHGDELARAVDAFRRLEAFAAEPTLEAKLGAGAIVGELLALWASAPPGGGGGRSLTRFKALLEERLDEADVSIGELARAVGITPDHATALFRRAFGMPPMRYRQRLRLERARELLLMSALPVAEVARRVGFRDPTFFARAFRRAYGCAPSACTAFTAARPGSVSAS